MEYSAEGKDDNALQRVVFFLQFSQDFSSADFKKFDEASRAWRESLPRRSVSNAVLFQPGSRRVNFDAEKIVGLSYESMLKDGTIEYGLRFDEKRILFAVGNYTQWTDVWPIAQKNLEQARELVPVDNSISSFSVEYTDLFRATGEYNEFDARNILRESSEFIPPHVFDRKANWHFHTGFFEQAEEPAEHRILTRINADLRDNDELKSRDLTIVLFHSLVPPREPFVGDGEMPPELANRGMDNFKILHDLDKSILTRILTDNMSKKVGLIK